MSSSATQLVHTQTLIYRLLKKLALHSSPKTNSKKLTASEPTKINSLFAAGTPMSYVEGSALTKRWYGRTP